MDLLPRIRKTKSHFSDAISWLLTSENPLAVGLVSGRRLLLFAVYHLLARRQTVLFMATESTSALDQIRQKQPSLLIVTPDLEDGACGIAVLEQAHQIPGPLCSILVVDAIRDDLRLAARSSASGVITEQEIFAADDLQDQLIMALARGGSYRSPRLRASMADPEPLLLTRPEGEAVPIHLTGREREVAALLMGGDNERAIAEGLGLSDATVRSHSQALRRKFAVSNRSQLVLSLKRSGFDGLRPSV